MLVKPTAGQPYKIKRIVTTLSELIIMMWAFRWDNHSDQCASKKPMNFAGPSFDAPRSEWSWINNTNIDHLKGDQGFFPLCQRFAEISVEIQIERPVSVSSDRNIRGHFWRWSLISVGTFGVTFFYNPPAVLCPF